MLKHNGLLVSHNSDGDDGGYGDWNNDDGDDGMAMITIPGSAEAGP